MKSSFALAGLLLGSIVMACVAAPPAAAAPANVPGALDPDRDGTVDLNEARTAATAVFDRLDRDHDGTLDRRELKGRLSTKELAAADPDRDGTLSKAEYFALVERRFNAADPRPRRHVGPQGTEIAVGARAAAAGPLIGVADSISTDRS